MKQKLISISKPTSKVQIQQDESELPSSLIDTKETTIIEELPEPTDIVPKNVKYAGTYHNGWKVSDILKEIRIDSFEMGSLD